MDAMPQLPFGSPNLYKNSDQHLPILLILDRSLSMHGAKIAELNAGLQAFLQDVSSDPIALRRIEVCIVTYGPVTVAQTFTTADRVTMPTITADCDTPMGAAIKKGLAELEARKAAYRQAGVPYFRPVCFHVTDGSSTDNTSAAERAIKQGEAGKAFTFFNVGVDTADMNALARLSTKAPLHLNGLSFKQMFLWLSHSGRAMSRSMPGTSVPLANPTGPGGWASVSV